MRFMRVGGLSRKNHRKSSKKDTFHSPPARRGVYCFVENMGEPFLVLWNDGNIREFKRRGYRHFDYEGYVWCHFTEYTNSPKRVKSWVCVHTDELKEIIKKVWSDNIAWRRSKDFFWDDEKNFEYSKQIYRPYNICIDDWEIFIEKTI